MTPAPGATPTPVASATPTPTPAPVTNDASTPILLREGSAADGATVLGNTSTFGTITGAQASTPIDGLACVPTMTTLTHYHVHFSLYVNGSRIALPSGTGIHLPQVVAPPYGVDGDPNVPGSCFYPIHTHGLDGVIHVEDPAANTQLSLGQFFDVWGQTISTSAFASFTGTTRWFDTDESSGAPGTHVVREVTGTDPHTIMMTDHHEYTVEVGPAFVPIVNYTWDGSLP